MPKYYVETGEVKRIVDCDGDAYEAAVEALDQHSQENPGKIQLGRVICVGQAGFEIEDETLVLSTQLTIEKYNEMVEVRRAANEPRV